MTLKGACFHCSQRTHTIEGNSKPCRVAHSAAIKNACVMSLSGATLQFPSIISKPTDRVLRPMSPLIQGVTTDAWVLKQNQARYQLLFDGPVMNSNRNCSTEVIRKGLELILIALEGSLWGHDCHPKPKDLVRCVFPLICDESVLDIEYSKADPYWRV